MSDDTRRTVLLLGVNLQDRWTDATPELQRLAHGLHHELGPLTRGAAWPLPRGKARLTRRGGRCEADGTALTFAPWQPQTHVCPACHAEYRGPEHDDWWALGAQLWCAERALHSAVLGTMWNDHALLALAQQALDTFSERWRTYPNRDNVLGPSRLFFSTYLESVWLLNSTLAAHLLQVHARDSVNRFVSDVVEPCRALIATYTEGLSNRQAWHTAALLSAASLLRDDKAVAPLIDGDLGVSTLIDRGLLSDGTWYEGENYHLFAHRGLWYGVSLLESLGATLSGKINARFTLGFRTPFLGVLPDGTFPSRRDSRYAVSVHQWRFAEWCELGLQRTNDELLHVWLHRLYSASLQRADTGRSRSTADIERDEPAQRLARSDLGWRTLLFARNEPWGELQSAGEGSVLLPAQGLHVLRRDADRLYVALEGGHTGGGHGHPDRLALTIQDGHTRVLEDPGTGSYVEQKLHWYRSTLAHNAPLINGRSQRAVAAQLVAFEARSGVAWTCVRAAELAPGVIVQRAAVLLNEHVVDHLEWTSDEEVTVDLPIHLHADIADAREWTVAQPYNHAGLEDGVGFLRDAQCTKLSSGEFVCLNRDPSIRCWYALSAGGELWRATAPGPPGQADRRMYWLRARGDAGSVVGVWSLRDSVESVLLPVLSPTLSPALAQAVHHHALLPVQVIMRNGTTALHAPALHGWHIDLHVGNARSSLDLQGHQGEHATSQHASAIQPPSVPTVNLVLKEHQSTQLRLGQPHYRGSEQSWLEAGGPTADVQLQVVGELLYITVSAHTGPVVVPERDAINALDNERADVNADGLQLYIAAANATEWTGAWLIVPSTHGARVTPLVNGAGSSALAADDQGESSFPITVQSAPTDTGWIMHVALRLDAPGLLPATPFRFDLIVNERPPERERRRGQLVLSGARGEFVYLRGDRHDLLRSWVLHAVPPHASHAFHSLSQPPV